ncbi:hypothetical protein BKP37_11035 [Anaerobacillus alkalilacustris]|uniref:Uncharacterized protein n=1 Tax=Anaerobacillus alkalilacustris TaxID=393763 RepID=A0A1S2LNP9_9BACI|nr:DUF5693 family protein [Anaerobacillus alkalilacustris]OIJ13045.1 hypothetical protein BKP37_11035 [Anaerobacillus alkalilacustris]
MNKFIWGFIIFTLVVSIPSLIDRVKVENKNTTYEVVIPFSDVQALSKVGLSTREILHDLQEANVSSISFKPLTIQDLEERYIIQVIEKGQILQQFSSNQSLLPSEDGLYIELLDPTHPLVRFIPEAIESNYHHSIVVQSIGLGNKNFYFIPFGTKFTKYQPISFDVEDIQLAINHGFSIVPRLDNAFNIQDQEHPLIQQITQFSENMKHMVFMNHEVPGFSENEQEKTDIIQMAEHLSNWDMNVVMIESSYQKGFHDLIQETGNSLVRLHSITLGKGNEDKSSHVYRSARALKERNIQMLYVNIIEKHPLEVFHTSTEAKDSFKDTITFLTNVQSLTHKKTGEAVPLQDLKSSLLLKIFSLIASVGFVGLCVGKLKSRLALPAMFSFGVAAIVGLFFQVSFLIKIVASATAVLAPVYAILSINYPKTMGQVVTTFFKVIGITIVGCWLVVITLYGWEYLVYLDQFKGVKMLSVLPLIIVGLKITGFSWLQTQLKFWHVILVTCIAVVLWFYVGRTGNHGVAIPFELLLRQELENWLGVRPRTKELLGYPIILFAIYLIKQGYENGKYFLILGVVACSSLVSTFTHFHTPLFVSIHRSVLSIFIGIGVGLLTIFVWYLTKQWFYSLNKERTKTWQL